MELNDMYRSQDIIGVIKKRRKRWVENVVRMGRGEEYTGFWLDNLRKTDHLENPGVDGKIILKWIFRKWDGLDLAG
jgi:hypothetical protein